ncbi:MAG: PorT family protein [Mediterranea sp.]|nr:PorT family protein [Mediterranea sp.]
MKKKHTLILLASLALLLAATPSASAQEERNQSLISMALHGWNYEVKAGVSIGGTAPLPLPQEIRGIDSYAPGMALSIEGHATKWFDARHKWGLTLGLRLENKKMNTDATVKNYGMRITNDLGRPLEGLWTGGVNTKVSNSYLTIPILANYQLTRRWKLALGPYLSYVLERNFSGHVYDGHLRTPDATGERVDFTGESVATYDFSKDLRRFQWGMQLGAEWRAFKHLNVYADFTWGLNDIFKKDFDTISFAMYPIYLNVGFAYAF